MSFNSLNRKVHYWAAFIVAVPLLVMIGSGVLLQLKKQWTWVQPAEHRGTGSAPVLDLEGIRLPGGVETTPFVWDVKGSGSVGSIGGARRARTAREAEERHRLLYVAMTRARDTLASLGNRV